MAPQSIWKSEHLRYPLGSDDLLALTGKQLNLDDLRRVRFFFFLGAKDENDSIPFRDGYDTEDEALAMRILGVLRLSAGPLRNGCIAMQGQTRPSGSIPASGTT